MAVAGVASITRVKRKTQIMFASIPLIFSLQQLMEGFVWITFTNKDYRHWQNIPVMIFLFLAQVVWPVWVPMSIIQTETERKRRIALWILLLISGIVAPLQAYRLFFLPAKAEITTHHIHYALDFSIPYFGMVLNVFYFMTTMLPTFFSSRKPILVLGFLNLTSFITTFIFFEKDVVSVWCFFAALISLQVFQGMKDLNKDLELSHTSGK